jgi:hypothetical protein
MKHNTEYVKLYRPMPSEGRIEEMRSATSREEIMAKSSTALALLWISSPSG